MEQNRRLPIRGDPGTASQQGWELTQPVEALQLSARTPARLDWSHLNHVGRTVPCRDTQAVAASRTVAMTYRGNRGRSHACTIAASCLYVRRRLT